MLKIIRKFLDTVVRDVEYGYKENVKNVKRYGVSERRWEDICNEAFTSPKFISLYKKAKSQWKKTGKVIPPLYILKYTALIFLIIGFMLRGSPSKIRKKKVIVDNEHMGVLNEDTRILWD